MAEVVQEAIASANKKIVDDNGLRLAREPKVELPTGPSGDRGGARGARRPQFQGGARSAAEVRDRRIFRTRARAPGQPRSRAPTSISPSNGWPRSVGPIATSRKAAGPKISDRVTVDFVGTIDGVPFEGGEGRTSKWCSARTPSSRASRSSCSARSPGEEREVQATFPEDYAVRALAGQDGGLRRDGQGGRGARGARDRRRIRQEASASKASTSCKEMIRERIAADYARASREKVKRQLLDELDARYRSRCPKGWSTRNSTRSGRRSSASRRPPAAASPTRTRPRRRPAPITARSPSAGCGSGCLLAEVGESRRGQGLRRRDDAGADRPRPRLPRPGEGGLGLLPQQSARRSPSCARRSTRRRSSTTSSASPRSRSER